ncbi:MAG: sigma-54-dependent transcriptional regulator [Candidatus Hydrothermarchaeales archaeon]
MSRILVVDDDVQIQNDILDILSEEDYEVLTAGSGEEALKIMEREGAFELIITDLMMPGMDGLELLKKIKEIEPSSMVIILTGHASMEKAIEAMRYGARDFIIKPFKVKEFSETIKGYREAIELKKELKESEFIAPREKIIAKLGKKEKEVLDNLGNSALVKYTTKEELTDSVEKIIDIFYKNGNPIIFVTPHPRTIQRYKKVSEHLQEGVIQIVDMPSGWAVGMQPSSYITIPTTHLFLFGDLIRKIPQNSVLIFEPLSQLLLARGFETTYQFLENYSEELGNRGIAFIALLKSSAHSPEEVGGIENIFLNTLTVSNGDLI